MTETLSKDTYLGALQANGEALAAAARKGLEVPVPTCPGWSVADLTGHVGQVYRWVFEHVERRATEMLPRADIPDPPADEAVIPWFEEAHARVVAALAGAEPDEPVWTWSTNQTAGFYQRRMAQETVLHRWDGENAHGQAGPLDGDLAADGVSELYEVMAPTTIAGGSKPRPGGSLHLHRTDGEGEWLLEMAGDQIVLTFAHAKGDAAVRAPGADLLLLGWGRVGLADIEADVFGDSDIAEAWLALSR